MEKDQFMKKIRPRRSALYLPGSKARVLEKAKTLAADVLIFDLEDSVAPEVKSAAREAVAATLETGGYGHRETIVRINGLGTPWGLDDLKMVVNSRADGVLVPKIDTSRDVEEIRKAIEAGLASGSRDEPRNSGAIGLWLMIETPQAILNAASIAGLANEPSYNLQGFVMGTNDLALETGADLGQGRLALVSWLQTALIAARGAGLEIIDGVFNAIGDESGFLAECQQGKTLGMDGKTLIHPSQIEAANQIFAPSDEDVAWSRRVLAAFAEQENQNRAVLQLDGKMVERLHAKIAQRVVTMAEAIQAIRH